MHGSHERHTSNYTYGGRDAGRDDVVPRDRDSDSAMKEKIKADIERIMKERNGEPDEQDYIRLYDRYEKNPHLVDQLLKASAKRSKRIRESARKAAINILDKYDGTDRPMHEILQRLSKWKKENKWTDEQYDTFYRELTSLLSGSRAQEIDYNQNVRSNRSRINRALGNQLTMRDSGLRMADTDGKYLDEILALYEQNIDLFQDVCIHSQMYADCSHVALTGKYKREKGVASRHIHPLFACMFFPKFEYFETRMLRSNMGAIIKARNDRKMLQSEADYKLYMDMISDPNDVVCDLDSPFADIRNRYMVQIALWEVVLRLRNGNYYGHASSEIMGKLNMCRHNLYDNADLAYKRDEGSMLRRLMSVFSMRPLIIYTKPVMAFGSVGLAMPAYGMGAFASSASLSKMPFRNEPAFTVTAIPMVNVTLPSTYDKETRAVDLRASMKQNIWLTHDGKIQPREHSIVSANGVLIFYVSRRTPSLNITSVTAPVPFHQLPISVSGFERINNHPVNCPSYISLETGEDFQLRSVVAVSQTQIGDNAAVENIITGCTGLFISNGDMTAAMTGLSMNLDSNHYLYDPFGASIPIAKQDGEGYFTNRPVSTIDAHFGMPGPDGEPADPSWYDRASRTGTVYIYSKVGSEMSARRYINY